MKWSQLFGKISLGLIGSLLSATLCFADPNTTNTSVSNQVEITTTTTKTPTIELPAQIAPAGRLWNLQDADILSVINEVSQETGRNFVVDPRVNGKITLISSKPLRKQEVYQVFLTVLGMLGYSAIPGGKVVKIVPNMESGEQTTPVANRRAPGSGEEVVVRVIPLENVSATQLIPILRPLLPQWSNISAYAPGNVLVLLGRASNLERIYRVIQDIDKASTSGIEIIPLHSANAGQIAIVLNNLQNAARATGEAPGLSIAVDDRSNSILIGGPKAMRLKIRVLIAQLDAPAASLSGNTDVVYLRYQEAKTLAPILGRIAQNILGKEAGGQYDTAAITTGGGATISASSGKNAPVNSSNIQAEPSTNALIITAPPMLMQAIKCVIAKLDIRPAEVQVEAIIAEIDESDIRSLGIQWGSRVGGRIVPNLSPEGASITSFPNLGAGVFGIIPSTPIRAVLSLLENMSGVDILSTPSIVLLDNQKGSIEVGQDVPFQTGSYTTPTAASNNTLQPFNTFQSKAVTLKLEVTPQINLSNLVRLKIKLKNDSLQNPQNPGITPIINTNKIENSVLIKSEDILVIGGSITKSNNESINKVPILGDVPIVGTLLFQQKTRNITKKNLVVFIKPIIMHTNDDAMLISHAKYEFTRRKQANFREDLYNIGREPAKTLLPPWKNNQDLPRPFEKKDKCPNGSCYAPPPNLSEEEDP